MDTTTSGKYYPVRDSCDKDGDPAEKCVYTEALYYNKIIPLTSGTTTSINIASGGETLVSREYENEYTEVYTPSELNCREEESRCYSKCHSKNGDWNSFTERCTVTYYLHSVCYRVVKENDIYQLDVPPYGLLLIQIFSLF